MFSGILQDKRSKLKYQVRRFAAKALQILSCCEIRQPTHGQAGQKNCSAELETCLVGQRMNGFQICFLFFRQKSTGTCCFTEKTPAAVDLRAEPERLPDPEHSDASVPEIDSENLESAHRLFS